MRFRSLFAIFLLSGCAGIQSKNPTEKEVNIKPSANLGADSCLPRGGDGSLVDQNEYIARQALSDGEYDLAIRRIYDVLDYDPKNIIALGMLRSAFSSLGETVKAQAVLKRIMDICPVYQTEPHFNKQPSETDEKKGKAPERRN